MNATAPFPQATRRYVDATYLATHFGVSLYTIREWTKKNFLPQPRVIGPRKKLWLWADIEAMIAHQGEPAAADAGGEHVA